MPWWALGASGMASNLDVSGTMIIAALIYALGVQGFFIEIRGGVVLILAFFMIFMGKWNRRAEVMTTAEWMEFRFGKGKQGEAARMLAAIAQLIFAIWAITYFIQGAGIFLSEILGISPDLAAILMISLCAFLRRIERFIWGGLHRSFSRRPHTICNYLCGISCNDEYHSPRDLCGVSPYGKWAISANNAKP